MLIDTSAILLNLLNIALIGLFAATLLLFSLSPFFARWATQLSAGARQEILWSFVAAPWLVGILCALLFLPSLAESESAIWLGRLAHWHHPYVFYLDSWHSAVLLFFVLGIVYVLVRSGLKAVRHTNALQILTRLSQTHSGYGDIGRDVVVLDSQAPAAFSAGIFLPRCYVTTGLMEQVSETELGIILDHERAHIRHKDTEKKLLFSLFASLYPKPVARGLNRLFSLASEQRADAQVCTSYGNFDIAQTLVKVARLQRCFAGNLHPAMVSHFAADDIDLRIRALVFHERSQLPPWGYCLLFLGVITLFSTVGVDALHHVVEAAFSH
ncbi:MAG: Zn-dependent protease with chaperone function [Glaciecola sp.]|jgi:Zn-dependent protease with chaperone function